MVVESEPGGTTVCKRAESEAERAALGHEQAMLLAAAHPGVVQFVRAEGGTPPDRLILRRVGARDLGRETDGGAGGTAALARIGAAVATTLGDLHAIGIAHGSICADHVLLDDSGRPVLCSFGRSRRLGSGTVAASRLEAQRDDVRALAETLLARIPAGGDRKLTAALRSARASTRSGRCDARWVARQLAARATALAGEDHPPAHSGRLAPLAVFRIRPVRIATVVAGVAVVALILVALLRPESEGPHPLPAAPTLAAGVPCPSVDQGCGPVHPDRGLLTMSAGRFRLDAAPGAVAVLGRWTCGPESLPAVLDVTTGNVWAFEAWPRPGSKVAGRLVGRFPGALSLRVNPSESGCDQIEVDTSASRSVTVPLPFGR